MLKSHWFAGSLWTDHAYGRTETLCAFTTHTDTNTSSGMRTDINACLCVCIFTQESIKLYSGRERGQMSAICQLEWLVKAFFYVASYSKLLGVKLLTILVSEWQWMNVQMARLIWLKDGLLQPACRNHRPCNSKMFAVWYQLYDKDKVLHLTCLLINPLPPLGSQVVHVQFLCSVQGRPKSIGRQSIAEERNQICSSVPRLPGMEGSAL